MARHFGAQHNKNGYAAMGNSKKRPAYKATKAAAKIPNKNK